MSERPPHILLIDDDPDMHEVVRMIVEPAGFALTCHLTAAVGLEAMRVDPPDLVLLDIMLANMVEGLHVLYEMKQDPTLKDIPVVMISAVGRRTGIDYAAETGTDYLPTSHFVTKPFDAATLLRTIRAALGREPAE